MTSFTAAAIQSNVTMVDSEASPREIKKQRDANLDRALLMIDWILKHRYPSVWADEPAPPLIGIPGSFLHSFPRAEGAQIKNMRKVAIEIPGEETDKIAAKAKNYGLTYLPPPMRTIPIGPSAISIRALSSIQTARLSSNTARSIVAGSRPALRRTRCSMNMSNATAMTRFFR